MTLVFVVQLYETSTERSASLLHSLISEPLVLIEGLRRGVIRTPTEAVAVGLAVGGRLEHIMGRGDLTSVSIKIFSHSRVGLCTWGSSVVKSSFCAFHARYTRLRPGCSVPGMATE